MGSASSFDSTPDSPTAAATAASASLSMIVGADAAQHYDIGDARLRAAITMSA